MSATLKRWAPINRLESLKRDPDKGQMRNRAGPTSGAQVPVGGRIRSYNARRTNHLILRPFVAMILCGVVVLILYCDPFVTTALLVQSHFLVHL